jgi:hypothetical protein
LSPSEEAFDVFKLRTFLLLHDDETASGQNLCIGHTPYLQAGLSERIYCLPIITGKKTVGFSPVAVDLTSFAGMASLIPSKVGCRTPAVIGVSYCALS